MVVLFCPKMAHLVSLFPLMFVVFVHHVSTTPSYDEYPRKVLQHRGISSLNSSSQLLDAEMMSIRPRPRQVVHVSFYFSYLFFCTNFLHGYADLHNACHTKKIILYTIDASYSDSYRSFCTKRVSSIYLRHMYGPYFWSNL